jgi:NAD+ synthase (glutamine-hydrolysing)
MRITIAQLNPTVGDVEGNVGKLIHALAACHSRRCADLVVFPELFLVGYPPKDLLEHDWFIAQAMDGLERVRQISREYPETGIVVGAPLPTDGPNGKGLHNAAVLMFNGEIVAKRHKALLPTYDVFDEERYFGPATAVQPVPFKGEMLGIHVCEDAWVNSALWPERLPYAFDPVAELARRGATLLLNISASPYSVGKETTRFDLISGHARRHGVPFVYVNQIGGNDDLIFDGRSVAVNGRGEPIAVLHPFTEQIVTIDTAAAQTLGPYAPQEEIASVHDALVLGLKDYLRKVGFTRAVIGLSGGIDSAVTCALAVAALGRENVLGVSMPSQYSSQGSLDDAASLAGSLGIQYKVIPIADVYRAYLGTLEPHFEGRAPDVTEENIQARIRGNYLMALSNKFGYLVLSTGNKSELAVGYCTLYGDMSGGLAVISDVPKMMVYDLAHYINREREVIPPASITKPPSAELRPNQTDQDTLPPYPILDAILHQYIEEMRSVEEIVAQGFDPQTVHWVVRAVDRNEYKRKQAAPGLRVTSKAFGVGRRMPIAARFNHGG